LRKLLPVLFLFIANLPLFAQQKTLQAVKAIQSPKIDGKLDEDAWKNAPVANDFILNFPTYGAKPSQKTEVKIIYDNAAVYVGAYIYDDPALIRKQLTARDGEQRADADYFSVFFDTYKDLQNGFQFLVTTANVQSDARLVPNQETDFGEYGDKTWDAVWDSRVSIKQDGWVVEIKIPYISLRFAKNNIQDWGIQFLRFSRRDNETSFWNAVNPQVNGFVNQFGIYAGLKDLQPPLRLSFSPYVSTGISSMPQAAGGYKTDWLRNGGMDVKYGLNESFTLDATLVPDFGQVISDNVVNNLTPFEIQFQENRQFFTEGTELFNKAGLFYSRRIGGTPAKYNSVRNFVNNNSDWSIVKNPSVTQLYNATKFSGRNEKNLGIGIFNAVTAPMEAKIRNAVSGKDSVIQTEPLANYNIIVFDQALKGRSFITFTNTNVMRSGNARDANVTAFDFGFYGKKNIYGLTGAARYSKIWEANPSDGYNTRLRFGKVSGNWQYYLQGNVESDKYNPNDLGILFAANEVTYRSGISYRQFTPTKNFVTYSYSFDIRLGNLYKPYAYTNLDLIGSGFWVFKNFWDVTLTAILNPIDNKDYFVLQTPTIGKYIRYPLNYIFELEGSTDSRKKLFVSYGGVYAKSPDYDNVYTSLSLGFRYRFGNKFSLDLKTESALETNQLGYAFLNEPVTDEPIAGFRDNKEFTSILSGIYNFTPRINVTLRTRHYWNKVHYISFHNVNNEGNLTNRPFIAGNDDNFNTFNVDAFFTWDFRLGSRLILGWKNRLDDSFSINGPANKSYTKNLGRVLNLSKKSINSRHANDLTLRFIYFLDYNQLKKKK
jgi:hypothetical protein